MKINFENLEPVFFINQQFSGRYDRANQLLVYKGEGVPYLELMKEGFEKTILFAQKNRIVCTVTDLTKLKGTFTSANSYIKERFIPVMMPLGYKYGAIVGSGDPFTQFAINAVIGLVTPKGLQVKMFSGIEKCEEWLSDFEEYKKPGIVDLEKVSN